MKKIIIAITLVSVIVASHAALNVQQANSAVNQNTLKHTQLDNKSPDKSVYISHRNSSLQKKQALIRELSKPEINVVAVTNLINSWNQILDNWEKDLRKHCNSLQKEAEDKKKIVIEYIKHFPKLKQAASRFETLRIKLNAQCSAFDAKNVVSTYQELDTEFRKFTENAERGKEAAAQVLIRKIESDRKEEKEKSNRMPFLSRNPDYRAKKDVFMKSSDQILKLLKEEKLKEADMLFKKYLTDKNKLFFIYASAEKIMKRLSDESQALKKEISKLSKDRKIEAEKLFAEIGKALKTGDFKLAEKLTLDLKKKLRPDMAREKLKKRNSKADMMIRKLDRQLAFLARSTPDRVSSIYTRARKLLDAKNNEDLKKNIPRIKAMMEEALESLTGIEEETEKEVLDQQISEYEEELELLEEHGNRDTKPLLNTLKLIVRSMKSKRNDRIKKFPAFTEKFQKIRDNIVKKLGGEKKKTQLYDDLSQVRTVLSRKDDLSEKEAEYYERMIEKAKDKITSGNLGQASLLLRLLKNKAEK